MASEKYPATPVTGDIIAGLDDAAKVQDARVYHAGTKYAESSVFTAGGRVLTVSAYAPSLAEARARAYDAVGRISWRGEHHRTDIGHRALG